MTLPVNVDTATVTGTFLSSVDGTPAVGTVTFQPVPLILDASADVVLLGVSVVATLDVAGSFSVDVVATDDPDLDPVDWCYAVTVRLTSPQAGWRFAMNALAGTTVDVSDAMPVDDPTTGTAIMRGEQGETGEPGPPGEGVPPGGAGGQVLAKLTGADFDTTWTAASAPGLHATTHTTGGTDPVTLAQSQVTGLTAAVASIGAHIADTFDAHDASAISYVAGGTIAATTVQGAIAEVATDAAAAAATKVTNVSGASGLWAGTSAAYTALGTYDPTVLYILTT